eukprot:PITA_17696
MDQQVNRIETHEGIETEFFNYFKKMNREPNINRKEAIDKITRHIPRLINEDHNTLLLKPISLQEVESAVNLLKAGKAPGPDGFTTIFFQHLWETIKWEVWQVVEESRTLRWMYQGMNATFIALIPKAEDSPSPEKYRPIALCNIIYKIVSKVIALRLKPLLSLIISSEQSGYVEGRHIMDGIILTHEIIHSLKQGKKLDGLVVSFLPHSSQFLSMAFPPLPFAHPEELDKEILSRRSCLSSWLKVLGSINATILSRKIKGISLHNAPVVSHHQFVDDNMLFGHPSVQEARSFNAFLNDFSLASGALINRVKSQLFFFNTPPSTQRAIARILGFSIATLPSKYLREPLIASTLKHAAWTDLLEKLEARLFLWTHRALNMASTIILIKAVLQSMPLYLFTIMAAPKWVLKAIKQL